MGNLHICAPRATAKSIYATTCLDCKKRTRMLQFFTPWYGLDSTCLRCGREYADGEWCSLPFSRFARKNNIEMAKKMWRAMPSMSNNHYGIEDVDKKKEDYQC